MEIDDLELGFLLGVLVGEGSFGGDGRQPSITVRMHTRHEALFRRLCDIVPGGRLYGPYEHGGRRYFQWIVRGPALRRLVRVLDRHITPSLDAHAAERYERMKRTYARALAGRQEPDAAPPPDESDIREARRADASRLAELVSQLGYPSTTSQMLARLDALTGPDTTAFVATAGGEVVGLAGVRAEALFEADTPVARLVVLVVDAQARSRGIGRSLLGHVEAWARRRGCARVVLTSSNHRTAAHAFYRAAGYRDTGVRFVRELG